MVVDFISANASVTIGTFVSMACLVAMPSVKSTQRKTEPVLPLIALSIVNGTLFVTQSSSTSPVIFTASLSATVSFMAYSTFYHYLDITATISGSDMLACLHMARVYRLIQSPLIMSLPATAASTAIHFCLAWNALDSQQKHKLVHHFRSVLALDGFILARLAHSRELALSGLYTNRFENEFYEHSRNAVFNPTQRDRFFVLRGPFLAEWKGIVTMVFADTFVGISYHWRRLLFVSIIANIGSPGAIDYPSLAVLLVVSQLLSLTTFARKYSSATGHLINKKVRFLLHVKTLEFFMASHCDVPNTWRFDSRIWDISSGISSLGSILSPTISQSFTIWIIY
ncbi:hypothetical protein GGF37_002955 [Kickxella alabastrina]|nr:hypothetical protein GGF37_002955 [Kickxella alabastrina]